MEPAAPPPRRPLRLLALHSFRTSAAIFRRQLARLGGLDGAELVFIDAPHAASGPLPEDVAGAGFEGPFFEWFTVKQEAPPGGGPPALVFTGMEAAEAAVAAALAERGPFDGLVGFSQGAGLAAGLAALQAAGAGLAGLPPIRVLVLIAGARMRHPRFEAALAALPGGRLATRACHIIGDADGIKPHCEALRDAFCSPLVLRHPRGHVVPALPPPQAAVLRELLAEAAADGDASGRGGGVPRAKL